MAELIDMKFNEEYIPLIEQGIKTCTTRRSFKGFVGDYFIVNNVKYELVFTMHVTFYFALQFFKEEGFPSVADYYDEILKIYPDIDLDSEVYSYTFQRVGEV